jgi:hypothetical protein
MPRLASRSYLIILGVLSLLLAWSRFSFPDLDHGDEFSDANVLNAGENFVRLGFIECRFLPMFEPQSATPHDLYTHYPPLPDIVNGLLRAVFRTDSLRFFRAVSILVSLLGLVFWTLFVRRITSSDLVAFLAALFYLSNPLFLFGFDSLHESSYSECLRSLVFYLTAVFLGTPPGRHRVLIGCALVAAVGVASLITFEYVVYLSLFVALFGLGVVAPADRISFKALLLIWLAPVAGFFLHVLQNVWYFGSVSAALEDLKNITVERMLFSKDAPGATITLGIWWREVLLRNIKLAFLFDVVVLAAILVVAYLLFRALKDRTRREVASLSKGFLVCFTCGITWYVLFPSHSWAHTYLFFLARHLLPAAALGFALIASVLLSFVRERLHSNGALQVLVWGMVAFVVWSGVSASQLPVSREKIRSAREFVEFRDCLTHLNAVSRDQDVVGVNFFRFPFIRYYTHRHVIAAFTPEMLEGQVPLPTYFVFLPYNNQDTENLLEFLNQRYVPVFDCKSGMFPSIFFELKR